MNINAVPDLYELRQRFLRGNDRALDQIREEMAKHLWWHNIEFLPGLTTPGCVDADAYVRQITAAMGSIDLRNKRVLDIGCRDGALSFAAERMGASDIVAIDNDLPTGLTDFLIPLLRPKIQAFACNVTDLSRDHFGEFDVVLFPGVLYHLRYPMTALRRISGVLKPGGVLLIERGFIEAFADFPVLFCPVGTDSPYEPTCVTFFNERGISDTLLSLGFSDVRLVDSYLPLDSAAEANYMREKFPKFSMDYPECKLGVCRKIQLCKKEWSKDRRFDPHTMGQSHEQILTHYWDGTRGGHTQLAAEKREMSEAAPIVDFAVKLDQALQTIAAMRSSPFWKARELAVRVLRKAGLRERA